MYVLLATGIYTVDQQETTILQDIMLVHCIILLLILSDNDYRLNVFPVFCMCCVTSLISTSFLCLARHCTPFSTSHFFSTALLHTEIYMDSTLILTPAMRFLIFGKGRHMHMDIIKYINVRGWGK